MPKLLETKREREGAASSALLPIRNTPSQSQSQLGKLHSFPLPLPPLHYSRCHSENGRPGSHKYGSAALAEICRQTKFINAQDSKLTCSASYASPPLSLSLLLSSTALCCCSKVKVCLKAVNNLTTKYESVKWPEEGGGW